MRTILIQFSFLRNRSLYMHRFGPKFRWCYNVDGFWATQLLFCFWPKWRGCNVEHFGQRCHHFASCRNLGGVILTVLELRCYCFASGRNLGGVKLPVHCIKLILFKSNFCKWFRCVLLNIKQLIIKQPKISNIKNKE